MKHADCEKTTVSVKYRITDLDTEEALRIILKSCRSVDRRIFGVSRDEFMSDDDMQKATAMDMVVIGNFVKFLPSDIRGTSHSMKEAHPFRCVIAHIYGSAAFELDQLWNGAVKDVPIIEEICSRELEKLISGKVVKSRNVRTVRIEIPYGECCILPPYGRFKRFCGKEKVAQ